MMSNRLVGQLQMKWIKRHSAFQNEKINGNWQDNYWPNRAILLQVHEGSGCFARNKKGNYTSGGRSGMKAYSAETRRFSRP
jgi:hypothetical protein